MKEEFTTASAKEMFDYVYKDPMGEDDYIDLLEHIIETSTSIHNYIINTEHVTYVDGMYKYYYDTEDNQHLGEGTDIFDMIYGHKERTPEQIKNDKLIEETFGYKPVEAHFNPINLILKQDLTLEPIKHVLDKLSNDDQVLVIDFFIDAFSKVIAQHKEELL